MECIGAVNHSFPETCGGPGAFPRFDFVHTSAKSGTYGVMPKSIPLLTAREAARLLGISYPTIKQWILSGKLPTLPTPGGHHRIAESTLKPFLARDKSQPQALSRERYRKVSGRNQLVGKVVSIRIEGLLAEVILALGDMHVTSIITANAVRELQLKKGDTAAALIKSTDVMIERMDN